MEKIEFLKNHNNFDVNIPFLEKFFKKDSQTINNNNFDTYINKCRNTNDVFLMLIKDDNKTLKLPNKKCKNLQLYIDNQRFQNGILSNLDAFIGLKNKSEYINEFILDYNRYLNNYTIIQFILFQFIEILEMINRINILI